MHPLRAGRLVRPTALITLVLACLLSPAAARAGAWSPAPGHGYAKLWLKWLYGFGYRDGQGESHDYGLYHEVFFNAYAEVGVLPRTALTLHFPLFQLFSLEDTLDGGQQRHATIGDPMLGVRYQFLSVGRLAASLEAGVRAPFARSKPVQTFRDEDGEPIGALRIGAGVWDVAGLLSVGYGWDRLYLSGSAGFVGRTGDFDDVATWSAEVGGNLRGDWHGRFRLVGYHSIHNGEAALRHDSPSGIGSGTRYVGFALELEYALNDHFRIGVTSEGGALLERQTGGPVTTGYVAAGW